MRTRTQSFVIGTVVQITIILKTKVHTGSTLVIDGNQIIIIAAIITPILYRISPSIWIKVALIFTFSLSPPANHP